MLHPVVVVAVGVLVANDHLLKAYWPGWVSGKLSDIAGLLFFPLFLQALVETGQALLGRWRRPSRRLLVSCVLATGAVFTLIQLAPAAGQTSRILWGWFQWPLQSGFPHSAPIPVALTPDPTDLLALPVLVLPWMIGRRRTPPADRDPGRLLEHNSDSGAGRLTATLPRQASRTECRPALPVAKNCPCIFAPGR